ncbi:MAG: cadherin domain-containing protein, partial [Gammaproteobacteria bacterium]|nr:cadherin domain-containing protein [Gammaproteobacteria bacterium]
MPPTAAQAELLRQIGLARLQGSLRRLLDQSRYAVADRNPAPALPVLLAPLVAACGGGGGGGGATARALEAIALNAANPNYNQPDLRGAVEVTGHGGANVIVTGHGADTIRSGDGADRINAGPGGDTIEAGAGDDTIVILGSNVRGEATYRAYTLSDLTNPRGESGLDVSGLVRLSDLLAHSGDDGGGDRRIDGGAGTGDTLVVFGRTDLSRADLQGIERIVIGSDVTLAPSQLDTVTQVVADDGAVLRLAGSGMVDLDAVRFMRIDLVSGVVVERLDLSGLRHIEIGANVVLAVPDRTELSGVEILSGAGQVQVAADAAAAFTGIRLMEGLRVAVNADASDPANVRNETVSVGDAAVFGGMPVPAGALLPSGGLRFEGAAAAAQSFDGTGNADRFELGAGDTATGGGSDDLFVLPATGTATVTDFQAGDRLRLEGVSAEQIVSAAVASGTLTVTMQGGNARSFTLTGVSDGNLQMQPAGTGVELYLNQGPQARPAQTLRVAEDAAAGAVAGVTDAADPDGDALTYSLSAGNADGAFAIGPASGQIAVADPSRLDHETAASRTLTVRVSDGVATTDVTLTVQIADVNERQGNPMLAGGTTGAVAENAAGAVIGSVTVTDPDDPTEPFGMHAFAVDDARFAVDSAGQLALRAGISLDHEREATVSLRVTATDRAELPQHVTSSTFTITVTDVNEPPQVSGDRAFTVAEGASYVLRASDLSATDPDAGDGPAPLRSTLSAAPTTGTLERDTGPPGTPD